MEARGREARRLPLEILPLADGGRELFRFKPAGLALARELDTPWS